jgi:hypothetical protein
VGDVRERGREEIDAAGLAVAPGFIVNGRAVIRDGRLPDGAEAGPGRVLRPSS